MHLSEPSIKLNSKEISELDVVIPNEVAVLIGFISPMDRYSTGRAGCTPEEVP